MEKFALIVHDVRPLVAGVRLLQRVDSKQGFQRDRRPTRDSFADRPVTYQHPHAATADLPLHSCF
ncbi:hypothetical protein [Burkholderia ubonensis]|uniref:hypothetical protein n=1 Tax=Burkholderia ubonensis TaxID=101571 RepID=UPI0012F81379|nr:hypothetical protein [Burkholderia ubonensis]